MVGLGSWRFTGLTGQTPSQPPSVTGDSLLTDASGNQYELTDFGRFAPKSLGFDNLVLSVSPNGTGGGFNSSQPTNTANAAQIIQSLRDTKTRVIVQLQRGCYESFSLPSYIQGNQDQMIRIQGVDPGDRSDWGAGIQESIINNLNIETSSLYRVPIGGVVYDINPSQLTITGATVSQGLFKILRVEVDSSGTLYQEWETLEYANPREAVLSITKEPTLPSRAIVGFVIVEGQAGGWTAGVDTFSSAESVVYYDIATKHQVFFCGDINNNITKVIDVKRENFADVRWISILHYNNAAFNTIGVNFGNGSSGQIRGVKAWNVHRAGAELDQTLNVAVVQTEIGRCGRGIINYSYSQISFGDGALTYDEGNDILGATTGGGLYMKNGGHTVGGLNTIRYCGTAVESDRQGTMDGRGERYQYNGACFSGEGLKYTETIGTPDDFDFVNGVSSNDRIWKMGINSSIYNLMIDSSLKYNKRDGANLITGSVGDIDVITLDFPENIGSGKDIAYIKGKISLIYQRGDAGTSSLRFRVNGNNTISPTINLNDTLEIEWFCFTKII